MEVIDLLWLFLALLGLIFVFTCICVVVDSHLVPAVEVIIEEFSLPEEIAAVTLIAFGSSTPEILLNTISAVKEASSLSMPALLGSAMIAFGLIPSVCILYNKKSEILIETGPIARETIFYLLGLFLFMNTIQDGVSTTREAVCMIMLYVFYVGFVVGRYLWSLSKTTSEATLEVDCPEPVEEEVISIPLSHTETHINRVSQLFQCLSKPVTIFFHITIPSVRPEDVEYRPITSDLESTDSLPENTSPENQKIERSDTQPLSVLHPQRYVNCIMRRQDNYDTVAGTHTTCHPLVSGTEQIVGLLRASLCRALLCILICIVYIGVFASLIVQTSSIIVAHIGLSQTTIGATFVSLGTEIPDLVSSIVLSRDGYYAAALAGATGSQVINITLGTGLPAFMMCLYGNGEFHVDDQAASLNLLVLLVMVIILGYLWLTTPLNLFVRCSEGGCPTESHVTRLGAYHQLILFAAAYLTYITINE